VGLLTTVARIIYLEAATGELQRWSDGLAKRRGFEPWLVMKLVVVSWGFNMAF
jgi:hypothetical protein